MRSAIFSVVSSVVIGLLMMRPATTVRVELCPVMSGGPGVDEMAVTEGLSIELAEIVREQRVRAEPGGHGVREVEPAALDVWVDELLGARSSAWPGSAPDSGLPAWPRRAPRRRL